MNKTKGMNTQPERTHSHMRPTWICQKKGRIARSQILPYFKVDIIR